jgi:uncharacterized beta-barrel protein YwiB (DUF1934 family)
MKLKVNSIDMYHEVYDKIFDYTRKDDENGQKRVYDYVDEYGNVKVHVSDDKVSIIRSGDISFKQIFEEDGMSNFIYKTNYLESVLTLVTKELIIESDKIKLNYELYNDGLLVNKVKMSISEE